MGRSGVEVASESARGLDDGGSPAGVLGWALGLVSGNHACELRYREPPVGEGKDKEEHVGSVGLGGDGAIVLCGCDAAASAACAAAPSFAVLAAALVGVGAMSVVAQIIVPLAASLAAPHERGQVVGTVMSGLLIGILASRTLSGLLGQFGGWRLVFAVAAAAMLALSVALRRALPSLPATEPGDTTP